MPIAADPDLIRHGVAVRDRGALRVTPGRIARSRHRRRAARIRTEKLT
ncbi:hypothetical protein [Streptomyces cellostaticus]|nr:hypothetical protein [Streptomyces cellostaticus]